MIRLDFGEILKSNLWESKSLLRFYANCLDLNYIFIFAGFLNIGFLLNLLFYYSIDYLDLKLTMPVSSD